MGLDQTARPLWKECAHAALKAELEHNYEAAEEHYRLSLTLVTHSVDARGEDTAEAAVNMADFLTAHGRYVEAEEFYRRAIDIYDKIFGADNLLSGMVLRVLAEIYNLQEQTVQAHLLNRRANSIIYKHAG